MLRKIISPDELLGFRVELETQTQFSLRCTGASWRNACKDSKTIREYRRFLMPFASFPVDVLVRDDDRRHRSNLIKPWLWTQELPFGSVSGIVDELSVTSPAFTLLQLASRTTLTRTVLLASELCGTYATYLPTAPMAHQLQKLQNRGSLCPFGGWRPCLDASGRLTTLWTREPLVDPRELLQLADAVSPQRGCKTLRQTAELVVPLAASPFETQTGILLGFSRRRGGEGHAGYTHNERIDLSRQARLIASREYCLCDLYWPDGLDIECQSAQHHDDENSFLSDSDRSAALELMGVKVLPLTYKQLGDADRFEAFAMAVAHARGIKPRPKTAAQLKAAAILRDEVLVDWEGLPDVG